MHKEQLINSVFSILSLKEFNELSFKIFSYQYINNPVYREFCDLLKLTPETISTSEQIPFLPIEFFKSKKVICKGCTEQVVFESSGTTSRSRSKHYVSDLSVYLKSATISFEFLFGNIEKYTFLALLPGYLERKNSSLVFMLKHFISRSDFKNDSGFYLNNQDELYNKLSLFASEKRKNVVLMGVSHALLNFTKHYSLSYPELIVMETGGMKGFGKELVRDELHGLLKKGFDVPEIFSEYGMTELLSQAYSKENGIFECPPWMRVSLRDPEDPISSFSCGSGAINIIDLANINSCSFIATSDLGTVFPNGRFEVLGRLDNSDIRGCNLMLI